MDNGKWQMAGAMAESLTFLMGKYPAVLPGDRRYCRNHMWCQPAGSILRFGFTCYAVRLMQDVYFLDWQVNAGDALAAKQRIGHIETSKAMSDLFAPLAGTMARFNDEVLKDPSAINVDTYGIGWLFDMDASDADTMAVGEYHSFLDANWERTQNLLKGHM
jgi:glycine cleavage system H protein